MFPQTLGMAMTWDRNLLFRIGEVVGTEARALYRKNDELGRCRMAFSGIRFLPD